MVNGHIGLLLQWGYCYSVAPPPVPLKKQRRGKNLFRHSVELFLGNTHEEGKDGFSIGLGYEYRIMDLLGTGLFAEYVDGDFREWVMGVPLLIHPYKGWRMLAAPGFDKKRGKDEDWEFLIRLGLAYEFENGRWSLTPEFNIGIVDGEEIFVYGVSFGRGF